MLAFVSERLAAHQPVIDGEALIELLHPDTTALVRLERGPALVERAEADAHHGPAAAGLVDGEDGRREIPRAPPRRGSQQRTELYPLRDHRGCPESHPRVDSEDGLPGEHAVPATLLAQRRELGELPRGRRRNHESVSHGATITRPSDIPAGRPPASRRK